MTVLDLIKRSLRLLGALNVGDNPTPDEQADGLMALNAMVESWASERMMMFTSTRQVFNVVAGVQVYLIGPTVSGSDWVAPRPMYIDNAGLLIAGSDPSGAYERPLRIIRTDSEWARVRVKGVTTTLPTALYYQSDFPNGQIVLWGAPSASSSVALYTPTAVSQFTSLTQAISLPPGYARALPYNLAVEFAAEFQKEPSEIVMGIADQSKTAIKRSNFKLSPIRLHLGIGTSGMEWDYTIGEPR